MERDGVPANKFLVVLVNINTVCYLFIFISKF